ncbi:Glycoside hydrolase family 18 protein [Mycena indigotica]|uniref:Glycoside hydrolase family 18 protein n=1 Tax=Mycena indigotica TaxID=2126181 RepID=A0A8H6S3Z9_9AGAR|nr:Glycoside hydrolase family 18 protein [Mycena indigotica]KAF7291893.1 Glycoside hydrolase family 18 protein [Mycena indigotica]
MHPLQTSIFLLAPLFVSAAQYCSLKPPSEISSSTSKGIQNGGDASDVVASAWYPGWLAGDFPPASISWSRYTAMTITTPDPTALLQLDSISAQTLPDFVKEAHSNGVDALLSIGGWTGSRFYSSAVASEHNRTAFVNATLALVSQYNLDGVDFDWEYPGKQGLGCNVVNPDDSANFLAFLQELRATTAGKNLILTAAVGITPFVGSNGQSMNDVSSFAEVLDRIAIMNYDVWGSWSPSVGPNAPLNDSCASAADQQGSAVSAVKAWTTANFPAHQIALGLAAYGHSFKVAPQSAMNGGNVALYPSYDKSVQPVGTSDSPSDISAVDPCGNYEGISGIFTFAGLIQSGFLDKSGTAASGIQYTFDPCSQTPFVYNQTSQVMVSYDDATSFAAKGHFINDQGLAGFAIWDVTGDQDDILLDSLHEAMGIIPVCA